jgi:hypothetical protein
MPVNVIAVIDPSPRHSSSKPNTPSFTSKRALAKGIRGAQHATPNPATRKASRVASRVEGWSACINPPEPTESTLRPDPVGTDHDYLGGGWRKAIYNYMHGIGLDADVRPSVDATVGAVLGT